MLACKPVTKIYMVICGLKISLGVDMQQTILLLSMDLKWCWDLSMCIHFAQDIELSLTLAS